MAKGAVATAGAAVAYAAPVASRVAFGQTAAGSAPPVSTPVGTQGCTPGFWKNNTQAWAGTGFTPGQQVGGVFTVPASLSALASATLETALDFLGGEDLAGGAQILLRAAVAALLNAAHPSVAYPLTTAQVISQVNAALASGDRATMVSVAGALDALNNLGCPLSASAAVG